MCSLQWLRLLSSHTHRRVPSIEQPGFASSLKDEASSRVLQFCYGRRRTNDQRNRTILQAGALLHANRMCTHSTLVQIDSRYTNYDTFHFLLLPKVEQSYVAHGCGSDYRSATPDANPVWFRVDMDSDELRDSPNIGPKAKDIASQEERHHSQPLYRYIPKRHPTSEQRLRRNVCRDVWGGTRASGHGASWS